MKHIQIFLTIYFVINSMSFIYADFDETLFEVPYDGTYSSTIQNMQAARGDLIQDIFKYENEKVSNSIASTQSWMQMMRNINNHPSICDIENMSMYQVQDNTARSEIEKCNKYIAEKSLRADAIIQKPGDFSDYFYQKNRYSIVPCGSIEFESQFINKQKNKTNKTPQLLPLAHQYLKNKHRLEQITKVYEVEKVQAVQRVATVGLFIGTMYVLSQNVNSK